MVTKINPWYLSSILVSLLVALPVLTVFSSFFNVTSDYFELLKNTFLLKYISNSFIILFGVLVLTLFFGVFAAGLGIYDTMQYIKPDVSTLCIGQAASMGSFLLSAGQKGKRFSLPNSRIMVHQPSAGFQGQATDIEIHANEVLSLKKRLNEIYSTNTGKPVDEIKKALERDNFMTPNNAKDFGLIDQVVEKRT